MSKEQAEFDDRRVEVGFFETTGAMRGLVNSVLDSGRISYGPLCKRLEHDFSLRHNSRFAIVSASGTDSLRAALHAMKIVHGWKDGDEVIVPATTFVATVNIVLQVGLIPVLVDVMPVHYTLDPALITQAITGRTRAIIPVNLLGQAANLSIITEIASDHDLKVIEDSCEAMFVNHHGRSVGSWGNIGCFSFYMAHLVTAGVGGIAITDNRDYADTMRSLLNHGRDTIYTSIDDDKNLSKEELSELVTRRFVFWHVGYSSRMTELQAALAIPQVLGWKSMVYMRNRVANRLTARLSGHRGLILPYPMTGNEHSWMMYGITMRDPDDKVPLVDLLEQNNIETRDLLPLVDQPVYHSLFNPNDYPVSLKAIKSSFYIGCHQGMTDADVARIGDVVDHYFGG